MGQRGREEVFGGLRAGASDGGEEAGVLEGEGEGEDEVGRGDGGEAEAGFGGVLEVGADVGEVDEGHNLLCFIAMVGVVMWRPKADVRWSCSMKWSSIWVSLWMDGGVVDRVLGWSILK